MIWSAVLGTAGDWIRPPAEREERRRHRQSRAAGLLARALGDLKGAFVKAGQFASVRHDVLPDVVSRELATLRDRVPPLPFAQIRRVVERAFGAPLSSLYAHFEPEPVGAASVAQVHRATLPDGRQVAVKVQYPWIEASRGTDLAILRGVLRVAIWLGGKRDLDLDRFFAEFAKGLEEELDFTREARVATEIAENLAGDAQIVVPRIVQSLTRRTVLTMSYHDAIPISDRAALQEQGVAPGKVLEVLARAYAKQVFVDGLFHADPHPGNLFVIPPGPDGGDQPVVLFVDFGLCKRLDPELRRQMRKGLYAVLQRDADDFVARMDAMGMIAPGAQDAVHGAVEQMFEHLAEQSGERGPLGVRGSQVLALKDVAKGLLQDTPGLQLPNDLLLYAKTLSYLFQLGEELDPEVDLVAISLPYLLKFLAEKDPEPEGRA
ncbi:MAG: AarF/UbiB family protein [Proteobacteria bacterium]|nr:AarF/UbiB family protein [Pseudomonadota bacterium]